MDIESNDSSLNDSYDSENESEEELSLDNSWNISYEKEKQFSNKCTMELLTYDPKVCPACNIREYEKKESKGNNTLNPFQLRCNNLQCGKKVNLRYYSIFKFSPNIPSSVIYYITEELIVKMKNAKEIVVEIQNKYNKTLSYITMSKKILLLRKIIAEYLKCKYRQNSFGGFEHENNPKIVAIGESLFTHDEQGQVWVVGGIETKLKNIRLDIIRMRNSSNLERFILNHFREGTHFTHDVWAGYSFLNNNINYIHETHLHGGGDF